MTGGVSAILLAGGTSSRMGTDKAFLQFGGKTLLEWQIGKLRSAGAEEILLSGLEAPLPGVRCVADRLPGCGPMGGISACLSEMTGDAALVLGVDTPLVGPGTLCLLWDAHSRSAAELTMLEHEGKWEPLIAVYNRGLAKEMEDLLAHGERSLRSLLGRVAWQTLRFEGSPKELLNCNTPDDYAALCQLE